MICFQFSAVGLTLNGVNHANNSIVTRTDIGTGSTALLCTTTLPGCCSSSFPDTQWYFPDGSQVQNNGGLPYYRTRSRVSPSVLLHRNTQGTTTGIFRCDILDASGVLQRMFVGICDSGTGESCTLSEWLVFLQGDILHSGSSANYRLYVHINGKACVQAGEHDQCPYSDMHGYA